MQKKGLWQKFNPLRYKNQLIEVNHIVSEITKRVSVSPQITRST